MSKTFSCIILLFSCQAFAICSPAQSQDRFGNGITEYSSSSNPGKAALILPPTGGENLADRTLAKGLCLLGMSSFILNYKQFPAEPEKLASHDEYTVQVLTWINDFLTVRPEKHWAILGSSLGSFYTSMAFAAGHGAKLPMQLPACAKIEAAVLTVSGGSLAEVLATSHLQQVVDEKNSRQTLFGFKSTADYQNLLAENIQYDTLSAVAPSQKQNILMFSSTTDVTVPAKTQEQLWLAWGKPERVSFDSSHSNTIIRVYFFHILEIFKFLKSKMTGE